MLKKEPIIIQLIHEEMGTIVKYDKKIYCNLDSSLYLDVEDQSTINEKIVHIHFIKIAHWARLKGNGTAAMNKIINFLHQMGYGISLYPCELMKDGTNIKVLKRFYTKLGFIQREDSHIYYFYPITTKKGIIQANIKFLINNETRSKHR